MAARLIVGLSALALLVAACGRAPSQPAPGPSGTSPASPPADTDPQERLRFSTDGWRTDFSRATIDLDELRSGGPAKDGIPAIDHPKFESIEAAGKWLADGAPVISVTIDRAARAYPIEILIWHEIVNDSLGGQPIVVTFCPLCNTALVFDRVLDGTVHDFGTTGKLRFSDLVMYDRQTETWWQQATGQGIVGDLAGRQLTFLPAQMISFGDFATAYPGGDVLSRDTGHNRPYGRNPYVGYDDAYDNPFLFSGVIDGRLAPKERVVTVERNGEATAFPYTELAATRVASTEVGGEAIVVFWTPGTASPLDTSDILGRDIGATGVFSPLLDGRQLTFGRDGSAGSPIQDEETGSTWSVTGLAVAGPLSGNQLEPIVHGDYFWFAWAAFLPDTTIWTAPR